MSISAASSSRSVTRSKRDGRNGALAALVVLFLDLLWRVTLAPAGVPSIPEAVVTAVARLTPTAIFGWATETFGSMAQNTLWALVLVGVVGAGYWAGQTAGQLAVLGRLTADRHVRLGMAALVGVLLFLVIAVGVFPLAREGLFAGGSAFQGTLLVQAALFAAVWAVAWTALGMTPDPASPDDAGNDCHGEPVTPLCAAECRRGRVDCRCRLPWLAAGESPHRG